MNPGSVLARAAVLTRTALAGQHGCRPAVLACPVAASGWQTLGGDHPQSVNALIEVRCLAGCQAQVDGRVESKLAVCRDNDGMALVSAGPGELAQDVGLGRVAEERLTEQADLLAIADPGPRRLGVDIEPWRVSGRRRSGQATADVQALEPLVHLQTVVTVAVEVSDASPLQFGQELRQGTMDPADHCARGTRAIHRWLSLPSLV